MEIIIESGRAEKNYWRDLWRYRELFYFLAWRDILVRYKQTVMGVAWAVVRPFLTVVVFTVVFSRIAKLPAPSDVPYPLLIMAGMLPWQFFATSLGESSNSLIGNSQLISKVYFPRLIVPAGSVITSFVDFLVTLALLGAMMFWYGFAPDWRLLFVPAFILLAFGASLGIGLWFCSLNVEYRDFRHIVPFVLQFGLYVSPVGFTSSVVLARLPAKLHVLYYLNPLVGVIDGFRWSLLRGEPPLSIPTLVTSVAIISLLCASGIWFFRKTERSFAAVI